MTWECRFFGSGTTIIQERGDTPWLYVYGPGGADESQEIANRFQCCYDLRDFLNGGPRPAWLDDLVRVSETHAEALDRTSVTATGPMIDRNPPQLVWVQDDSDEAQSARARLMDKLFLSGDGPQE